MDVEYVENELIAALRERKYDWKVVGRLVQKGEENWHNREFWKGKTYKNITSWVKSLSAETGSKVTTIWGALRSVRALETAYFTAHGQSCDFGEIVKRYPDVSTSALMYWDKLNRFDPTDKVLPRLAAEVLTKSISAGQLKGIYDEKYAARMEQSDRSLVAYLHEMNLSELLGDAEEGRDARTKTISNLPGDFGLEAVVVVPRPNGHPEFIGFASDVGKVVKALNQNSSDRIYLLTAEGETTDNLPSGVGHIEVNVEDGRYKVVAVAEDQQLSNAKKGRLGMAVINRLMLGRDSFIQ